MADTIQINVNDNGNTGTGGGNEIDLGTLNIDIDAVNDDPMNAGTLPADIAVTEDVLSYVDLSDINLNDVDAGSGSLTVTLTTASGGNVTAAAGTGISLGGTSTELTLSGTLADLNAYICTASNIQYLHATANTNGDNADTIQINVNDNGNIGVGRGTDIDLGTLNIDIDAVNDAPTNTVPNTQSVAEETATAITGISITDPDAGVASVSTRLQVNNGVLNIVQGGGVTISAGSNASPDVTLLGNIIDINTTLATLTYTGNADVVGAAADSITVTTDDGGNTGSGGSLQAVDTIQIDITEINDTPTVNAPAGILPAIENVPFAMHGIGFSVSDSDASSSILSASLSVTEGVLDIVPGDSAISIVSGNGTASVSFSGTVVQINTLLSGSSSGTVEYINRSDNPVALSTITLYVNDRGNSGSDPGVSADAFSEESSASQIISVTAVNDEPRIVSHGGMDSLTLAIQEGQTSVTTVQATDPDTADVLSYSIANSADSGLFSIDAISGMFSFNEAQDFENPADVEGDGTYEIHVQVSDSSGLTDSQRIDVIITNVNESPTSIALNSSTVDENIDSTNGVMIGTLTTVDPDTVETVQYSIVEGEDSRLFSIGGVASDQLILTDGILDAERKSAYTVSVQAMDVGGLSTIEKLLVTITDIFEPTIITGDTESAIVEDLNTSADSALITSGTLIVTDPEGGSTQFVPQTLTGDYGTLSIDASGQWEYHADNLQQAIQALAAGETQLDTLVVTTEAGLSQLVTVIIEGTDDLSVLSGQASGKVDTAGSMVVTGSLNIHDADTADNPIWLLNQAATPGENGFGEFSLLDNEWTYELYTKHPQVLEMKAGDFLDDGFWFTASDDSRHWVTIRIGSSASTEPALFGALPVFPEPVVTPPALVMIPTPSAVVVPVAESIESSNEAEEEASVEDTPESDRASANTDTQMPELEPISVDMDSSILSNPSSTHATTPKDNVVLVGDGNDMDQGNSTAAVRQLKLIWDQDRLENELTVNKLAQSNLDRNVQEIAEQFEDAEKSEFKSRSITAQVSAGVGLTLAAGYVTWALQAGSMLASLFASMPVWRQFDPLPILANKSSAKVSVDNSADDENKSKEEKQRSMDKNANELLE